MPIPKPNKEETNEQFVERCMADEVMQEYDEKQRLAICETQIEKKENKMDIKKRHIIEIIEDEKTVTIVYEKDIDESIEEDLEEVEIEEEEDERAPMDEEYEEEIEGEVEEEEEEEIEEQED